MRSPPRGPFAVLLLLAAAALPRAADPPAKPDPGAAAGLVRRLGHEEFAAREAAEKRLREIGEPALPLLRKAAAGSDDPEVRHRADRITRAIVWGVRTSKSTGLEMVPVPAGEFLMGSPKNEAERRADEDQHRVRITRTFLLGIHEVTQDQYRKVTRTGPSAFSADGEAKDKVKGLETGRFPVESVSWYDAVAFCNTLSAIDGYEPYYTLAEVRRDGGAVTAAKVTVTGGNGYRLPTEAEWEYACRARSQYRFHFGYGNSGREANLKPGAAAGGYGGPPVWQPLGRTAAVGSYKPNAWTLADMHGNVAEWCQDWYDKDYYKNSPGDDPRGPDAGDHRVLRGGSWLVGEGSCRSASRFSHAPDERKDYAGFRVARTP